MYCKKCGYEISISDKDIKYCKRCGAKIENELFSDEYNYNQPNPDQEVESSKIDEKNTKQHIVIAAVIALLLMVGILTIIFVLHGDTFNGEKESKKEQELVAEESINPFDYVKVIFGGENGSGVATIEPNGEFDFFDDLKFIILDNGSLSNGNLVKINVAYKKNEEDFAAKYNKRINCLSKDYTVENLKDSDKTEDDIEEKSTPKDSFVKKMQGVWGRDENGSYYMSVDGSDVIKAGWFESETLPDSHIISVEEVSENIYKVLLDVDSYYDVDGTEYEGYTYSNIYDGSFDDFKTRIVVSNDNGNYLLLKMGNDMDSAWNYYCGGFHSDFASIDSERSEDENSGFNSKDIIGTWMNLVEDPVEAFSSQYQLSFHEDGTVDLIGYRNKDHGTYILNEDGTIVASFEECYFEGAGEGLERLENLSYTLTATKNNEGMEVKFDDDFYQNGYSNASDGIYVKR